MHAPVDGIPQPVAALFEDAAQTLPPILASDDDDHDDRGYREGARRGHDDDDDCRGGVRNPAPTGSFEPLTALRRRSR
jgi:hypothetical protein